MTKEELTQKYPKQFPDCFDFSIGKGWISLIENLCYFVDSYEKRLYDDLKYAERNKDDPKSYWYGKLDEIQTKIKKLEENPFKWLQIKEKFGGLRAYCINPSDEIYAMVRYAETLSYGICEDCGCPAKVRTKGWIRYLCEDCAIKSGKEYSKI